MISRLIQFFIIFSVVALVITIFPQMLGLLISFLDWILDFGKWGVVGIISCVIITLIGYFKV